MDKVLTKYSGKMIYKTLIFRALACFAFLAFSQALPAQDANIAEGKTLFTNQCASCHNRNMRDDMTGPALAGVQERWADYPAEDLYNWIRNSQGMIAAGHPRATELWDSWKPNVMNPFPQLTDPQIDNILAYINCTAEGTCPGTQTATGPTPGAPEPMEPKDNTGLFIILAIILAILAVVLARIVANLNYMIQVKEGDAPERRKTLVEILTSKGVIAFVIFALVVLGGYTTVSNAVMLGRQQGYQPEQPIKFPHDVHAGLQKIDCQFCHDGARRSKHAIIPPANTCMNCHRAVKVGTQYGTAELTKVFASIGYDPNADTYMEDAVDMTMDEYKQIYARWIADNAIKSGETAETAEEMVEEQWSGIVRALTDEELGDEQVYGPIEWIRIHNLPDHAYFNHAQHVTVGKVECQTCHGPVQEMEEVYQYSPLSMGWCVNCHRQTEVEFDENAYYDSYTRYVEELESGEREKVTVEDIGGLECQKCHY